ncbi:MAG TPA: RNA polymerase sigma factor [Verrucomicrobiae bacterium]|nr:RNA polymerase sigma factor [Verrucomicrobiae bacterium]
MELSLSCGYNRNVFSLSPTFVETEVCDTRSLLDQARAGDAEAFGEICRVHGTRLLRQAVALCGDRTLAEDLAQDTLVEAWKCLRRYNGRCKFFTWLCAILLNRYRNALRGNRLLPASTLGVRDQDEFDKHAGNLTDHAARPDQAVERREEAILVQKCVQALPAKHMQVIYLRFYVDDSLEEIAAALGCPVGTVKSRLFHALDKLRKMQAFSGQLSDFKTEGGML